jgi:hypothetical protein
MWILAQDKKTIVNLDRCEYIGIYNYTRSSIEAGTSNDQVFTLGEYDQERAAQVFDELLTSLAKGDQLFRMPEK